MKTVSEKITKEKKRKFLSKKMVNIIKNDPGLHKQHEEAREFMKTFGWAAFMELEKTLGRRW